MDSKRLIFCFRLSYACENSIIRVQCSPLSATERARACAERGSSKRGERSEAEYRIEFPIHNATIMGRIDVLGNEEVRDYKASQDYVDSNEVSMQIRLYTAGLRKLGRQVERGSIAYLSSENVKIEPIDVSEPMVDQAVREAETVVKNVVNGHYEPKQGPNCEKCDQQPICRWRSRTSRNA